MRVLGERCPVFSEMAARSRFALQLPCQIYMGTAADVHFMSYAPIWPWARREKLFLNRLNVSCNLHLCICFEDHAALVEKTALRVI